MGTQKVYDIVVKVGEYQAGNGETKARYLNVGSMMQKDDGGKFILLDRTFNPAGVPNPDGRSNVILSLFDSNRREGGQRQQQPQQQQSQSRRPPPSGAGSGDMDDDVPFAPMNRSRFEHAF